MKERGRTGARKRPRAKLTQEEAECIRSYYAQGVMTQQMLGEAFGVARSVVGDVVSGKRYNMERPT